MDSRRLLPAGKTAATPRQWRAWTRPVYVQINLVHDPGEVKGSKLPSGRTIGKMAQLMRFSLFL